MKKIILLAFILIVSTSIFAQKNKKSVKSSTAVTVSAVPKTEISNGNFNLIYNNEKIVLGKINPTSSPVDSKVVAFNADGSQLYLVSWSEKKINKTDMKTEDITTIISKIIEKNSKNEVFSNTQTTTQIAEKVYLDKLKGASETQTKIRREGLELVLNPDGSITQKNKTQSFNWKFNTAKMGYIKQ